MSILDDLTSSLNRGAEAAGRASSSARIKGQMNSLLKQRQSLCAQLGASLYDIVKNDASLREGREALFDEIATIDTQRTNLQAQLDELQAAVEASVAAAQTFTCPDCGTQVSASDMFCSGCGKPVADIKAAAEAEAAAAAAAAAVPANVVPQAQPGELACPTCGSAVSADDVFCMNCGTKLEGLALAAAPEPAAQAEPVPTSEPTADSAVAVEPEPTSEQESAPAPDLEPAPTPEPAPEPEPEAKAKEKPKTKSRSSRSKKKTEKPADESAPAPEPILASEPEPATDSEPALAPEPVATAAPVPEPAVPTCPTCGAPIKESDKFCMKCGTPVGVAASATVATEPACPNCGATVRPQDKFCLKCGTPL